MKALVLGAAGQDGSYLTEQLLEDGHETWGLVRRASANLATPTVVGDLLDRASLDAALRQVRPDVVFNLAAVTAPGAGWGAPQPPLLAEVTGLGVVHLLEAMAAATPDARLVHASSSAIFDPGWYGPYAVAKRLAHDAVEGFAAAGRLHASNAVFYSHTSPRQDPRFLARRICTAAATGRRMVLGDTGATRDWGFAPDFCEALQVIARQDKPGSWIVATGKAHSVGELAWAAVEAAGASWADVFSIDPHPTSVPSEVSPYGRDLPLVQDLGWRPRTGFRDMVEICVRAASAASSSPIER